MLQMTTATTATNGTSGGATAWATPVNRAATFASQASRMRLATDTSERRRGLRVRQIRPVKVLDMVAGRTAVGQTVDVSATGMKVRMTAGGTGLRVGQVLGLHVGLSRVGERLPNRRQMMPVRVVWVGPVAADGSATTGVEFATGIGAQRDAA